MRLPRAFFARDARLVAEELLGMSLVRVLPGGSRLRGTIVETEAYLPDDRASHSFRGRTARNAPMFMRPGTAYVYLIYGMHTCFNISTGTASLGAAVLIRALAPVEGLAIMQNLRSLKDLRSSELCRGPGNLCKAMAIGRELSGYDMHQRGSVIFVARGHGLPAQDIGASPRIGVRGDEAAISAPWRYYIMGEPSVSGRRQSPRHRPSMRALATHG